VGGGGKKKGHELKVGGPLRGVLEVGGGNGFSSGPCEQGGERGKNCPFVGVGGEGARKGQPEGGRTFRCGGKGLGSWFDRGRGGRKYVH